MPPEMGPVSEVDADMENGNVESEIPGSIAERCKQAEAVLQAEEASMPFKEGQNHYLMNARSVLHLVCTTVVSCLACLSTALHE